MISKQVFVDTLKAIKDEEKTRSDADRELKKLGLSVNCDRTPFLSPLLGLLKAAVPDPFDYISWWLFEDLEHTVSWEDAGKPMSVNVDAPEDLYDYLTGPYCKPLPENLPFIDLPEESKDGELHRGIEEADFTNYLETVVDYVDACDAVIHIMREGETKYILMSAKRYEACCRKTEMGKPDDKGEMVEIEIEVETELYEKAKEALAQVGFTPEQACEMFLCWCALYQEDASAWIKRAMKELGIQLDAPQPNGFMSGE